MEPKTIALLACLIALTISGSWWDGGYRASLVYMFDGYGHRWHPECGFPHSWDNKIEYIIDKQQFRIHYG